MKKHINLTVDYLKYEASGRQNVSSNGSGVTSVKNINLDTENKKLKITYTDDTVKNIDISSIINDIHIDNASFDATNNTLTLHDTDNNEITIDLSVFAHKDYVDNQLANKQDVLSSADIKSMYESNPDTNAFTDEFKNLVQQKKVKDVSITDNILTLTYTDDTSQTLNIQTSSIIRAQNDPTDSDDGDLWLNSQTSTFFVNNKTNDSNNWEPVGNIDLIDKGEWNSTTEYYKDDIVTYNNAVYYSKKYNKNVEPGTDDTTWNKWFSIPNLNQIQDLHDEVVVYHDKTVEKYNETIAELNGLDNLTRALQQIGVNFFTIDENNHLIANYADPIQNVTLTDNKHLIIEY